MIARRVDSGTDFTFQMGLQLAPGGLLGAFLLFLGLLVAPNSVSWAQEPSQGVPSEAFSTSFDDEEKPSERKPPKVSSKLRKAIAKYLVAPPERERAALKKVLRIVKDDVALAAEALRTHRPLLSAKPGTHHDQVFRSEGREWKYSIYLPPGYDGRKRFPVLVLPDHVAVGAPAGINFWTGRREAQQYILFRPVITRHKEDPEIFPRRQMFDLDQDLARVMQDALAHLRLCYAVDHDRFSMTGLSQAGYYTWYYAVSFPDDFAAIIPESAGGLAMRASIFSLLKNLSAMQIRILHSVSDKITPYSDAQKAAKLLEEAGARVELISFQDADYPTPNENFHPVPHLERLNKVLPWAHQQVRKIPSTVKRQLRYRQQWVAGRFLVTPPDTIKTPISIECQLEGDVLTAQGPGISYLASPEDVLDKREFRVRGKKRKAKANLQLLFQSFKRLGDPQRLFAGQVQVTR